MTFTNKDLTVKKIDGRKFQQVGGYFIGKGWAVYNTAANTWLSFGDRDNYPWVPQGGKQACESVAETIELDSDEGTVLWIKEME